MPSAATNNSSSSSNNNNNSNSNSVKVVEKINNAETTSSSGSCSSSTEAPASAMKQALVILEHKIRNLEKRKVKLESYRELQNSGKELNSDQLTAIAKFDEVLQTLDFARELSKQFQNLAIVAEKEYRKYIKKELAARSQQELEKIREVLLVQDALQQLGHENVREDFLYGRNGAVLLSESDLKLLDDLYPEVTPKHSTELGSFTANVQAASEHLLAVVDGKPKEAFGSTYAYVKEVIGKVHESGYFDQANIDNPEYIEESYENADTEVETKVENLAEVILEAGTIPVYHVDPNVVQEEIELISVPTPVLEQQFYQPTRPISEVIGAGAAFYFLQDSELDSPEQIPQNNNPVITNAAIPTQTFTNQSFVGMQPPPAAPSENAPPRANPIASGFATVPPPPIPMPPSHLTTIEYTQVANMSYPNSYQPQEELQPQQPPRQQKHVEERNGEQIGDGDGNEANFGSPKHGQRPRNNNNSNNTRRTGGGGGGNNNNNGGGYHQSFYQPNNGYSNRPRRGGNGSGARTAGGGSGNNRPPMHQNKSKPAQQH